MRNKWKNFSWPQTSVNAVSHENKGDARSAFGRILDRFGQFFDLPGFLH
jgi:hypothetical protein